MSVTEKSKVLQILSSVSVIVRHRVQSKRHMVKQTSAYRTVYHTLKVSVSLSLNSADPLTELSTQQRVWIALLFFPAPLCNVALMRYVSPPAAVSSQQYRPHTPDNGDKPTF